MEESSQTGFFEHADQYRRVNEGIHRSGDRVFVCECLRADCNALIELAVGEYEAVRADATRFFVVPGHELAELDTVIERYERHVVVYRSAEGLTVRDVRPAPPA